MSGTLRTLWRELHGGSAHYRGFVEVLAANPDFSMFSERARELRSVNQLVDDGFLTVSDAYLRWVDRHGSRPARRGPRLRRRRFGHRPAHAV